MKSRPAQNSGKPRRSKHISVGKILRTAYLKYVRDKVTRRAVAALLR